METLAKKLADILGITVEAIQENAIAYILEYGRFKCLQSICFVNAALLIIGLGILGIYLLAFYSDNCNNAKPNKKSILGICVGTVLVITIGTVVELFLYYNAPMAYSIEQCFKLLK